MKNVVYAFTLATLVLASAPASPKGQTVRIEISGASLATPLEITDAAILGRFNIWNGPGVEARDANGRLIPEDEERSGAFIDWRRGIVSLQPSALQAYHVVFYHEFREHMHESVAADRTPEPRYVVRYAYDPAADGGYIYLPGRKDGDAAKRNWSLMYHPGVEGNWFHSAPAWERLVRPLIEKAVAAAHSK